MGLPPTSSKFSGDANNVTTFFYDFPNFTGSHTGVTATMGINSVTGGGTGLATLTANNVILGNGASPPTFVAPGTSGNILSSNGITWSSTSPVGNSVFVQYASSQVTTQSSTSSSTFVTAANSPAFTFTPTTSGTYKVYSSFPGQNDTSTGQAVYRIFNTSGGATLLQESQNASDPATTTTIITGVTIQSTYTLTSGVTYVFDLQYKATNTGSAFIRGDVAPFYMFAEGVGLGAGTFTTVGAIDAFSPVANGLQIISNVLYAQSATASFPGMVDTTTQSFAGVKTFTSPPVFSSLTTPGVLLNDSSGIVSSSAGPLAIANGGTDNATLPVTAGGVFYSDGTKFQNVGAGTAGQVLTSNGASPPTWGSGGGGGLSVPTSEIWVTTGTGLGSTNTAIRTFTTVTKTQGTDISYTSDAANGDSWTINTTGVYAITYCETFNTANFFGVLVNGTALSTPIQSTTVAQGKVALSTGSTATAVDDCHVTLNLTSGDIIMAGTAGTGASFTNGNDSTSFRVVRVT